MSKGKNPFFSLGAQGSVGDCLTVRHTRGVDVLEKKPFPTDPQSLAQIYQRWDYQDYVAQWNTLSVTEKRTWHSNATRFHMTGFAYFMSYHLKNLPDLAARYHLDERGGALAIDTSRNLNHGTVLGPDRTPGRIDYACYFDGIDDRITVPYDPSLNLREQFTIFFFLNQTAWPHDTPIFLMRTWNYQVIGSPPAFARAAGFFFTGVAWRNTGWTPIGSIIPGTWQSLAVRWEPPTFSIFLDGQFSNSNNWPGDYPANVLTPIFIGTTPALTSDLNAHMDNIIIYNRAITNEDIARLNERRYP